MKFELKKLKHFPSLEWGEDGGTTCDIYMDGKKCGNYFNDGNGGIYNYFPEKVSESILL